MQIWGLNGENLKCWAPWLNQIHLVTMCLYPEKGPWGSGELACALSPELKILANESIFSGKKPKPSFFYINKLRHGQ